MIYSASRKSSEFRNRKRAGEISRSLVAFSRTDSTFPLGRRVADRQTLWRVLREIRKNCEIVTRGFGEGRRGNISKIRSQSRFYTVFKVVRQSGTVRRRRNLARSQFRRQNLRLFNFMVFEAVPEIEPTRAR